MKKRFHLFFLALFPLGVFGQIDKIAATAKDFLASLDNNQRSKTVIDFSDSERHNWHFVPRDDWKGINIHELNSSQQQLGFSLLQQCLSKSGYEKATQITQLENLLRVIEARKDNYRDPKKYYFTFFGTPDKNKIWGWRFQGHHCSFTFSFGENKMVSGTPGFMGSNPAIVLDGPEKGKQVLKVETDFGFSLLHALNPDQITKAVISKDALKEIITFDSRKAMIENPGGITYGEMNKEQQQTFMQLISLYVNRYTKLFADDMIRELKEAGLNNIHFSWAGELEQGIGKPHYYCIQGPTIIIEYDNTQNNANHVHTVVRDLKHDFGGDELLEHYKKSHQ